MSRSSLPDATQNPRFTGLRSFMRLPGADDDKHPDVAIVGIPFDTAASFRPGQRFGPSAVRDISVLLRPSNQFHGINAFDRVNVIDTGDVPAIPGDNPPLTVTGTVKTISNGRFRNKGPMGRGVLMDMGPSVVIDTGKIEIALISRHVEPSDLNCLLSLGIDPSQKRYVMLKSRIHWRAGFGKLAKAVVECAGVGVCTSDYGQLQFNKVRRPIYPLDLPNR